MFLRNLSMENLCETWNIFVSLRRFFVCCKVAQNAIIFHQTCLLLCMTYKLLFIADVYPGSFRRYFIDGFLHQGCSMMIDGGIIGERGERPDYLRPTNLPSHHKTFPSKKAVWAKKLGSEMKVLSCLHRVFPLTTFFLLQQFWVKCPTYKVTYTEFDFDVKFSTLMYP